MPSVNLEIVRSMFAAWEQGDFGSAAWADSEIELVMADGPQPGSWTGIAGMAAAWREFLSTWEDGYRTEADEYRELDGERVLVPTTTSAGERRADWRSDRSAGRARTSSTSATAR